MLFRWFLLRDVHTHHVPDSPSALCTPHAVSKLVWSALTYAEQLHALTLANADGADLFLLSTLNPPRQLHYKALLLEPLGVCTCHRIFPSFQKIHSPSTIIPIFHYPYLLPTNLSPFTPVSRIWGQNMLFAIETNSSVQHSESQSLPAASQEPLHSHKPACDRSFGDLKLLAVRPLAHFWSVTEHINIKN